jgi:hypothetical protein
MKMLEEPWMMNGDKSFLCFSHIFIHFLCGGWDKQEKERLSCTLEIYVWLQNKTRKNMYDTLLSCSLDFLLGKITLQIIYFYFFVTLWLLYKSLNTIEFDVQSSRLCLLFQYHNSELWNSKCSWNFNFDMKKYVTKFQRVCDNFGKRIVMKI